MTTRRLTVLAVAFTCVTATASAQPFTYDPPGQLVPANSGKGRVDAKVYATGMRFPMESPKAFANSQVYGRGGGQGPGGGQCDTQNYSYPWHDNYCESRSWTMPLCPSGTGHQGQDIRPGTCVKDVHWGVAAVDGRITQVGSYSVYLTDSSGRRYEYLHMSSVQVKVGDTVKRGARLGKISNAFGGTPTTIHLHFNLRQTVSGVGTVFVPPYTSLVDSYRRLLDPSLVERDGGTPNADAGDAGDAGADADIIIEPPDTEPEIEPPPDPQEAVPEPPVAAEAEGGCGCRSSSRTEATSALGFVVAAVLVFRLRSRALRR
jgi:murein DD-endopeptidase MepM/ murein hydrolase activator NlpD